MALNTHYTAQIVAAVAASKSRVLIQSSWSALQGDDIPDSIYQLGPAPHDWLLPRMAAVVHHG
jgi:sterol 3beta-glucosyltransferase